MGLNRTRYRTFADDIQARKVARQIERNLMGVKPNHGGRKQMNVSGHTPPNPSPNQEKLDRIKREKSKIKVKNEENLKNKITNLEDELDKVRQQNGRAIEKSTKNANTFWGRNKKDIIDAVIVLGVLYIAYKMFFDKEEVMPQATPTAEVGGEVEI